MDGMEGDGFWGVPIPKVREVCSDDFPFQLGDVQDFSGGITTFLLHPKVDFVFFFGVFSSGVFFGFSGFRNCFYGTGFRGKDSFAKSELRLYDR